MLLDIGEAFLRRANDNQPPFGIGLREAGSDPELDARCRCPLESGGERVQGFGKGTASLPRGSKGAYGPTKLGEPFPHLIARSLDHVFRSIGVARNQTGRPLQLDRRHGEAVADGVVHLPRKPLPLFQDRH